MTVKYQYALFITLMLSVNTFSQVGIGTDEPHPTALLELSSEDKGFLIPRMTTSERDEIVEPAEGLEIFSTTDQAKYFFDGKVWERSQVKVNIGNFQMYSFGFNKLTENSTEPIVLGPVEEGFDSESSSFAEINPLNLNQIKVLKKGFYSIELSGLIQREGTNKSPITGSYTLEVLRGGTLVFEKKCFQSLGMVYDEISSSATSIGCYYSSVSLNANDIITLKARNVDGSANGFSLKFENNILMIRKINTAN